MNVGELIKQLGHYPDDMPVTMAAQPDGLIGPPYVEVVYRGYDFILDRQVVTLG